MSTPTEKVFYGWPMIVVFITGVLISWGVWSFQTGAISRVEFDSLATRVAVLETEILHPQMNDNIMLMATDIAMLKQASKDLLKTVQTIEGYLIRQSKLNR